MFSKKIVMPAVIGLSVLFAAPLNAQITINEVLGSTSGSDSEFIELYNAGGAAVDISGYNIYLWDSDAGAGFGGSDGAAPYTIDPGTILAPGDFYCLGNANAASDYGITFDQALPANAIENSSYTIHLTDSFNNYIETVFVRDSDPNDKANIAGTVIVPDLTVGPDGSFLPAGFYRTTDGGPTAAFLNFNRPGAGPPELANGTPAGGTPCASNVIPEPATVALMSFGLAGIAVSRRRRNTT